MTDTFISDFATLEQAMELFPTAFRDAAQALVDNGSSYAITTRRQPKPTPRAEQIEFVMAGIRLLDERHPDWRESIDWHILNMGSTQNCILGQLYQYYYHGLRNLGITLDVWKYGFESLNGHAQLTRLWKELAQPPNKPSTGEEPEPIAPYTTITFLTSRTYLHQSRMAKCQIIPWTT